MAYSKDKINEVRRRYIFDRLALDKVAALTGVSTATALRWKKRAYDGGDDWDRMRAATLMSSGELENVSQQMMSEFIVEFRASMQIIKDEPIDAKLRVALLASLSESYRKMLDSNKKLMPEVNKLSIAMTVLSLLGEYIKAHKPEAMALFAQILEPFSQTLADQFEH